MANGKSAWQPTTSPSHPLSSVPFDVLPANPVQAFCRGWSPVFSAKLSRELAFLPIHNPEYESNRNLGDAKKQNRLSALSEHFLRAPKSSTSALSRNLQLTSGCCNDFGRGGACSKSSARFRSTKISGLRYNAVFKLRVKNRVQLRERLRKTCRSARRVLSSTVRAADS